MAIIPVILLNGTTADANEVMADFNEIYTDIDETNVPAGQKTGTGRFVLQDSPTINGAILVGVTLNNPTLTGTVAGGASYTSITLTNPTISGNVSGTPTFLGAVSFSSLATFNAGITLPTTQRVNLNVGGTTWIDEVVANNIRFVGASTELFRMTPTLNSSAVSLSIASTNRLYLDGGNDTYITESAANVINFFTGGINRFRINNPASYVEVINSSFVVDAGFPIFMDGGTNDYWVNSANGQNDLYANGILALRTTVAGNVDLQNQPGITDYTRGQHNHENAAGGGQLNASNVFNAGAVPVNRGGTGVTSSFTAGSVIFSNGSILTEDNANFFWDDGSNFLGLGTASPDSRGHLLGSTTAGARLRVENSGTGQAALLLENTVQEWTIRNSIGSGGFQIADTGGSALNRVSIPSDGSNISFDVGGATSSPTYTTTGRIHAASGTTVTVCTVPLLSSNTGCFILAKIAGKRWGAGQPTEYFIISGSADNNAGTLTLSAVATIANASSGGSTLSAVGLVASGTSILVQATANVGFDVDVVATAEWQIATGS